MRYHPVPSTPSWVPPVEGQQQVFSTRNPQAEAVKWAGAFPGADGTQSNLRRKMPRITACYEPAVFLYPRRGMPPGSQHKVLFQRRKPFPASTAFVYSS